MGFLIDTNVLSEIRKGQRADPGVLNWFNGTNDADLFVSVLTFGEIRKGIELIRRRDTVSATNLENWFEAMHASATGRVLLVTQAIADRWGRLNVPDPMPVVDGLLAATALEHKLTLVTRNIVDFARTGVLLHNPFSR